MIILDCFFLTLVRHSSSFLRQAKKAYLIVNGEIFFSHLPKDGIAEETIKLAHNLAQTPPTYRNVSQNKKIEQCMNTLIQLKRVELLVEGLAVLELAGLSKRVNSTNTKLEMLLECKNHLESSTTSSAKELRRQCMKGHCWD